MIDKNCFICKKGFTVHNYRRKTSKFCSFECRFEYQRKFPLKGKENPNWKTGSRLCNCGRSKHHNAKRCRKCFFENRKSEDHWNWRGKMFNNGYVMIKNKNHPFADHDGYVFEHRIIAEKILGKFLNQREVIHHINHNRTDNRPENLYLFSSHSDHVKFHRNERKINSNLIMN